MSSPLGILLALPTGRRAVILSVTSATARAIGIVFIAEALVRTVLDLGSAPAWIVLGLLGALLRGASLWADQSLGTTLSVAAKRGLRSRILATLLRRPGRPRAKAAVTVTRGIDDLDDYFTTVVPALTQAAVVPLVLLVRILFTDVVSAAIIVLCLPLVPLFMVLIGRYTVDTTAASTRALERLSDHLAELAEGLPVLIGLGRSRAHAHSLRRLSEDYHAASQSTLRIAFLSSLALELIATISVALVAVFIGVRLVYGMMELGDGLLALLLAPECFMPLRALGAGFHASENGREAHDRAHELLADDTAEVRADIAPAGADTAPAGAHTAPRMGESVVYPGGTTVTWTEPLPSGPGITAVVGASGAGKTTVLSALTGSLPAGAVSTRAPVTSALVPQAPRTYGRTIGEELMTFGLTEAEAGTALAAADLPTGLGVATAALSPGQLRRLAFVRTLARRRDDGNLLVLDEPTAHLDAENAEIIIAMIAEAARDSRVVLASHDPQVLALADETIRPRVSTAASVTDPGPATAATDSPREGTARDRTPHNESAGPAASARDRSSAETSDQPGVSGGVADAGDHPRAETLAAPASLRSRWATLRTTLPLRGGTMVLALLAACASSLAAISLTGVSAWLIVEASFGPPIMTLLVAIVGVRFFGIARSVLLYVSRLKLHSAIFSALGRLRTVLWSHFERAGMSDRTMLSSDAALATMVADADEVRDLVPRTLFPPVVSSLVFLAVIIAVGLLDPGSVSILLLLGLINLVVLPVLVVRVEAPLSRRIQAGRARILSLLTRALGAKTDLRANRAENAVLADLAAAEDDLASAQRASATGFGLAQTWIEASTLAAALTLAVTSGADTEILAVIVLVTVGLAEVVTSCLGAWRQMPALGIALDRLPPVAGVVSPEETESRGGSPLTALELTDITVGWDGVPVLDALDLTADSARWTVVCGESGSGKTTTVSVLLRFLTPWSGGYRAVDEDGHHLDVLALDPGRLAGRIAWCPQEAHVFRSTVRGNLALARPEAPADEAMFSALRSAGLGHWATEEGLDRWVGDHGSEISGGERQRLAIARTLLSGAEVVILDEPTAHLDAPRAHRLIADLRASAGEHTVVMVTHDRTLIEPGDRVVELERVSPASIRT